MLEKMLSSTDTAVHGFVFSVWDTFHRQYLEAFFSLVAIAVVIGGYLLWLGKLEVSLKSLGPRLVRIMIPLALVSQQAALEKYVYNVATKIPEQIGTALTRALGETDAGITTSVDGLLVDSATATGRIWDHAGIGDVAVVALGALISGVTAVFVAVVAVVLVVAKVATGILLALAPFAIALLLFDGTRSLFEGWLRQLLGFALTPVFLFALLGLLLSMVREFSNPVVQAGQAEAALPSIADVAPYLAVMLAAIGLTKQVVSWSSGVAGAMALALNSPGLGRAAAAALRTVQAGMRSAAQARGGGSSGSESAQSASSGASSSGSGAQGGAGASGAGATSGTTSESTAAAQARKENEKAASRAQRWRERGGQAARTAAAFGGGMVRHATGMRPARRADPSWRPAPAAPPKVGFAGGSAQSAEPRDAAREAAREGSRSASESAGSAGGAASGSARAQGHAAPPPRSTDARAESASASEQASRRAAQAAGSRASEPPPAPPRQDPTKQAGPKKEGKA
jgi:type IV secretion system protein VirB6